MVHYYDIPMDGWMVGWMHCLLPFKMYWSYGQGMEKIQDDNKIVARSLFCSFPFFSCLYQQVRLDVVNEKIILLKCKYSEIILTFHKHIRD